MSDGDIPVNLDLTIPSSEVSFRASRSGGPGGQHANTSSTRVELIWDVNASEALTEAQRDRLQRKLSNRITSDGLLILASSTHRSQHRNREEAEERLAEIVRQALHVPKRRKKTKPSRAARERRLQAKKRQSEKKRLRRSVTPE